jgi:uncharacterized DUF497 family protein
MEFDWDAGNVAHVQAHGVQPEEAVEAFYGDPVLLRVHEIEGEPRSVILGKTSASRILVVVSAVRDSKIRVVTAFPAKRKLRRLYEEAQNG